MNVCDRKAYLQKIDEVIARGRFKDNWESLAQYETPKWYRDAKFGIFIHWGIYSVPAYGSEWYSRSMYIQGTHEFKHHVETYGPQKDFGYKRYDSVNSLTYALRDLYKGQILPAYHDGLSAAVYTQLSDVEDEINGFYTYDRKICKVNVEEMQKLRKEIDNQICS